MSYCMGPQDYEYPCSNRNKCRNNPKRCRDEYIHERPERDTQRGIIVDSPPNHPLPPTEPPGPGEWELQYCKWSGWTWVKKADKEVTRSPRPSVEVREPPPPQPPPEEKKKKGGFFSCCFKKKEEPPKPHPQPPPREPKPEPSPPPRPDEKKSVRDSPSDEFCDCCCCAVDFDCCCSCNQCCPCMAPVCCCCNCKPPEKRRDSKTIETQTVKEMKEQETKMSEMHIPKPRPCCCGRRRRCRCRRPVCCPCRSTCCPCVQPVCCSCNKKEERKRSVSAPRKRSVQSEDSKLNTDKLINFCLANNLGTKRSDFDNYKKNYTLHKSLDLLLKNNINILSLFSDKKELTKEVKPISIFDSDNTITSLSSDNLARKADQEHCKLLTAVCDAILSSHKFDNEKLSTTPQIPTSRSDSKESFNIFSSKEILGRILSDLNFSPSKSNEDLGVPRESIQVNHVSRKPESFCYPKKSLTKLIRNKSRILAAPRFPKKIETLRKLELIKAARDDKTKRGLFSSGYRKNGLKSDETKRKEVADSKVSLTDILKNHQELTNKFKTYDYTGQTSSQDHTMKMETVDALLNSLDIMNGSTSADVRTQDPLERSRLEALLQSHQNAHLLDATSPSLTDIDLLLANEEEKREKEHKGSSSG